MIAVKDILDGIKSHYEKAIAFAVLVGLLGSLVYLAVQVGLIRGKDENWRNEIEDMNPSYKDTDAVDEEPYIVAFEQIALPSMIQLNTWTNEMLTIPKTRAWCVDCKAPIPMFVAANQGLCPWCFKKQPPDKNANKKRDLDNDGMLDVWEDLYGLDPTDETDAQRDKDEDLFTNLEEFTAKTDPTDPKSYPPIEVKLYATKIVADPFKLRFKSVMKISPVTVVQTPEMDVTRFSGRSVITLNEDAVMELPGKKKIKAPAKSLLKSLGRRRFKLSSGEDVIDEFQLLKDDAVIIPASGLLEIPGMNAVKMALPMNTVIKCANLKFALNLGRIRTYFMLLNETVQGFKLAKFEKKIVKKVLPGSARPRDVDVSELTLQRGEKSIVLVRGKDVMHNEYTVSLIFTLDDSKYKLRVDESFKLKDVEYKLISVDSVKEYVLVKRLHDKQDFIIKMTPNAR
ncbi:MAG: hypothetical protein KAH23_05600 [Kiritimatiellae bacterium]|nr:hypothetical protein [Kiritimatiellia bacterium]